MIDSAMQGAPVDAVLPVARIAAEIERLAEGGPRALARPPLPARRRGGSAAAAASGNAEDPENPGAPESPETEPTPEDARHARRTDPPGTPSSLTCPECQGVLFDVGEGSLVRFRCRVGHAYNGQTLASEQSRSVEAALWTATRLLEERAILLGTLAGRMQTKNHPHSARRFSSRAEDALRHADAIRALLTQDSPTDVPIPPVSLPGGGIEDIGQLPDTGTGDGHP
jgi:two-component system, chemotaxis family, protein-glutamate methylesterase/glutaminase